MEPNDWLDMDAEEVAALKKQAGSQGIITV